MAKEPRTFFTTNELADRWRISPRTLEGWRDKGIGPTFTRIGNRVRYHISVIERAEHDWSSVDPAHF
ncbi:helix-turn-helix domain-containing protein [Erythrobacter sp. F6033]|uniref:helix-turn-helix transcriptional regulator n=1 Tax=Erythrobacter sp. F6033 TaxID=2926401 RepID=UPI001FF21813|nr:helix-turn-helix domain-containing protein [Erythrobacter sp. F6033]MCK0129276.1 helix-turn-helix domain-containing protein [Erythrobacter sp. F6033]